MESSDGARLTYFVSQRLRDSLLQARGRHDGNTHVETVAQERVWSMYFSLEELFIFLVKISLRLSFINKNNKNSDSLSKISDSARLSLILLTFSDFISFLSFPH